MGWGVRQNLDNPDDRLTIFRESKYYILALNRIRHFLPLLGGKNLRIGEARSESYLIIGLQRHPFRLTFSVAPACTRVRDNC